MNPEIQQLEAKLNDPVKSNCTKTIYATLQIPKMNLISNFQKDLLFFTILQIHHFLGHL